MKKYLLDSNVLISLFKNKYGIREAVYKVGRLNCAISELTIGELLVGAYKGKNLKQVSEVELARQMFKIVPIDTKVIDLYAQIRATLELSGKKIDHLDLLIGCSAITNDMIMVSHNCKHLERIPGIRIEDWEVR